MHWRRDAERTGFVLFLAAVRDYDCEIGEDDGSGKKEPFWPPGDEDRSNDAAGAYTHRNQVAASPARLLLAEAALGTCDREDI